MLLSDELAQRAKAAQAVYERDLPKGIAVDTETSGLNFYDAPFCATVAWNAGDRLEAHYLDLRIDLGREIAGDILNDVPALVFHNAGFDMRALKIAGLLEYDTEQTIHDTQALAHLADEHQRLGLKKLAEDLLGIPPAEEADLKAWFKEQRVKKAERNYADVPPNILIPYAVQDAEITMRLFNHLWPQVARYPDLLGLYELEMDLCRALLRMEGRGMHLDVGYLENKAREYARKGLQLEVQIRRLVGDPEFNPASPQQVQSALSGRGHEVENTQASTLGGLDDELAKKIVELREVRKVHGTYLLPLLQEHRNGIVHPSWRQHAARTGRMSSGAATRE